MRFTRQISGLFSLIILASLRVAIAAEPSVAPGTGFADLQTQRWIHGAADCDTDSNPPIQVVQAARASYVLRQNKCATFEAPFMYLLIGDKTAVLVDTGAIESSAESPLYQTVRELVSNSGAGKSILVIHSHSHRDHTRGDAQFQGKQNVEVVGTDQQQLEQYFSFQDWPNQQIGIDLGGRELILLPTPGHQEQGISIYDAQTGWLLTGDTLYPGLIRVKNWDVFRASIARMAEFGANHPISMVLGAHIEFNRVTGETYRIGSTYQPDEMPLPLGLEDLNSLHRKLQQTKSSTTLNFDGFVISPLSRMEKILSRLLSGI